MFVHNEANQLVSVTSAAGHTTTFSYDANGNVIETQIENKRPQINATNGLPTGSVDDLGLIVNYQEYDILDNLIVKNEQFGPGLSDRLVTEYRYDRDGNEVLTLFPEFVNDANNVASTVYDERGKVYTSTRGGLTSEFRNLTANSAIMAETMIDSIPAAPTAPAVLATYYYEYDVWGNNVLLEDADQRISTKTYDGFHRVKTEAEPELTAGTPLRTEVYEYDPAGNKVEHRIHEGSETGTLFRRMKISHDEHSRPYQTDQDLFPVNNTVQVLEGPLSPGDNMVTSRTVFDARGLAIMAIDDNQYYEGTEYDGAQRPIRQWDSNGRLVPTQSWDQALSVNVDLAYDGANNLIYEKTTDYRDDGSSVSRHEWSYYDSRNLMTATVNEFGHTWRWLHDSRGNVIFESDPQCSILSSTLLSDLDGFAEYSPLVPQAPDDGHQLARQYSLVPHG